MRVRLARSAVAWCVLAHLALAGCGGSGGDAPSAPVATTPPVTTPPATSTTVDYPASVVLGLSGTQDAVYTPASGATSASVSVTSASALLRVGSNTVVAEHVDTALAGLRVVCVSGNGQTTNVVTGINPGVLAKSAAVLLTATWSAVDATAAYTAAIARGGSWTGWENCGVKPEGSPSPSSRLTPRVDGGYGEDVYDGNPGTTYNVVSRNVAASVVSAMLSDAGYATVDDPARPLRLRLRAYRDSSGNTIFVETGDPVATAPSGTQGFIAPYFWTGS